MFRFQEERRYDNTPSRYDGTGIWPVCPDCGYAHRKLKDPDFEALLSPVHVEIGDTTRDCSSLFGIRTPGGRCTVLPDSGMFRFTAPDGRTALAPYGLVASWNKETHSWLWAWGFPQTWEIPDPCLAAVRHLRRRAETNGWRAVTTRLLKVNQEEAWRLSSLAAHVQGFPMVFCAHHSGPNYQYFIINRLRWTV